MWRNAAVISPQHPKIKWETTSKIEKVHAPFGYCSVLEIFKFGKNTFSREIYFLELFLVI